MDKRSTSQSRHARLGRAAGREADPGRSEPRGGSAARGRHEVAVGRRENRAVQGVASVQAVLQRLGEAVGEETMHRYLGRSARVTLTGGELQIGVPNRFAADLIERRLGAAIRGLGGVSSIRFDVATGATGGSKPGGRAIGIASGLDGARAAASPPGQAGLGVGAAEKPVPKPARPARRAPSRTVHAAQTLDSFVVGPSNRFAFAAASRIADRHEIGDSGPFFLYGPCGVGKTHLINAVANRYRDLCPGARTRIVTAETFTNEYIAAIRSNTIESFHRLYRRVDLLCIDDVHFLATKTGTQTELLHTFDHIGNGGGRIVLASDSHPGEIQRFSNALTSRFISGSLVRIDLPDVDTRRKLLVQFAARAGLRMSGGALSVLESVASADAGGRDLSVRDLAGIINRVNAYIVVMGQQGAKAGTIRGEVSVADVEAALRGQGGAEASMPASGRPVSAQQVVERVCDGLEVTREDLAGKGRHPRVVLARAMVSLLARRLTRNSYPEIAHALGRSNHSTVITAHRRIEKQIAACEVVRVGLQMDGTPISVVAERLERSVRAGA